MALTSDGYDILLCLFSLKKVDIVRNGLSTYTIYVKVSYQLPIFSTCSSEMLSHYMVILMMENIGLFFIS